MAGGPLTPQSNELAFWLGWAWFGTVLLAGFIIVLAAGGSV